MDITEEHRAGDPSVLGVPVEDSVAGLDQDLPALVRLQAERLAMLESIIGLAPVGIGIVDLEGRAPLTNDTLRDLLGYSAQEFATMTFSDFSHPADNEENLRLFARLTAGEIDQFSMEKRFVCKDGRLLWTFLTVSLVRHPDGSPAYGIGMTQDISDRKELEATLRAAEEHYRLLVERVPAVVYTADVGRDAPWHYVSPQIEPLLGYTPEEWVSRPGLMFDRIVPEDRDAAQAAEDEVVRSSDGSPMSVTYRIRHRDGHVMWVRDAAVARSGRGGGLVLNGVLVDVTQEKLLEEALARQAVHDPLTGLVNRGHFRERVDRALAGARRGGPPVAMLFIDLDGFKAVNDTLGHGTGDEVLATVAGRLAASIPDGCLLARLGGDEFALLVDGGRAHRLSDLADRLLASLAEPVQARSRAVRIGASIGGTVAGLTDTTDTLLHDADQSMYRAKSEGGGRYVQHQS